MSYEGYGPGGVAILIEAMTDNKNRTTPEVRSYCQVRRRPGRHGSVAYPSCRQIVLEGDLAEDKVMEVALRLVPMMWPWMAMPG